MGKYTFFEIDGIEEELKETKKIKESKKTEKAIPSQKRVSIQGLEDHIFNEKNIMKYFFRKTRNRAKKYELYFFFFNSQDLNLNNKIDTLIDEWHKKQGILKKDTHQWYYPNLPEKENEITKILS